MKKENKADICPSCGSQELSFDDIDIDDIDKMQMFYPYLCKKCGCKGAELIRLKFEKHISDDEYKKILNRRKKAWMKSINSVLTK